MAKYAKLEKISKFADKYLNHAFIDDWSGAKNGLQIDNSGNIAKIASAVDANILTIAEAINLKADLLVVHHGLFWNDITPLTGHNFKKIKMALDANLAIYSSHLPLDINGQIGNNILLSKRLGLKNLKQFFELKGSNVGLYTNCSIRRVQLQMKLHELLGAPPVLIPGGPEICRKIGIITGGAGNELSKVSEYGIDTYITGEGAHWTFGLAYDLGINVIYGGHYATETFGVQALGNMLAKKFQLSHTFIDMPSGL